MKKQWDRTIQYIPSVHNVCNGKALVQTNWLSSVVGGLHTFLTN